MKKARRFASVWFLVMGILLYALIAQSDGLSQAWSSPARPNASSGGEARTSALPAAGRARFAATTMTHTLTADADTEVRSANGDANYGSETTMTVGNDYVSNHYRAYAHFDLSAIPDGAVVQAAALRLHVYTTHGGNAFDVEIYRPQAAWGEDTLTWNAQPVSAATGITTTVDSVDEWFEWDVTRLAQDWAAGDDNYGLALRAVDEASPSLVSANVFDTREADGEWAEPPQLIITYTCGACTWTVDTTSDDLHPVSLRYALTNASAGDTIQFDPGVFPTAASGTISLSEALPQVDQGDLTIDGSSAGVILDGSLLPAGTDGLTLASDGNTVAGLQIQHMPGDGISITGDDNLIGGLGAGEPNVIVANGSHGILIQGSDTTANVIRRNYIGTDEDGQAGLGNSGSGIAVASAHDNVIGVLDDSGNVIVSNAQAGIAFALADENLVLSNYIGRLENSIARANGSHGVTLVGSADNLISQNRISFNGGDGVRVQGSGSLRNTILANSIYQNDGKGIENTDGGNQELQPPTWTARRQGDGAWRVDGTTCADCTVEIYSNQQNDYEGRYLETSAQADGDGYFAANDVSRTEGFFFLTTTDGDGNTSEFGYTDVNVAVDDTGALEVTQAVQDRNNSVRLIQNKATFVRFHVHANKAGETIRARLRGRRNGEWLGYVFPNNPDLTITTLEDPDRGQLDQSFWFELPSDWLTGTLTLQAEVNYFPWLIEMDSGDNLSEETVTFQYSPPMNLVMWDACYTDGGTTHHVRNRDRNALASWLRRAYPVSKLNADRRTLPCSSGQPTARQVNQRLLLAKTLNILLFDEDPYTRYYGMIDDSGGFQIGRAVEISMTVASGPAGPPPCCNAPPGWETDSSYADWYGAHELGHTYGRYHAMFCGAAAGRPYPYPNGDISPSGNEDAADAMYGFDIEHHTVYTTGWKDLMSYCEYQWVSDFTYQGIHDRMIAEAQEAANLVRSQSTGEYLAVLGTVVTATDQITLEHFYRIPDAWSWLQRTPGDYSIRLLDGGEGTLADYPFTPRTAGIEPSAGCRAVGSAGEADPAFIAEFVPWVSGTAEVAIYHQDAKIASRPVSAHPPTVTVESPNGGESLTGATATLSWHAGDDDGDELNFTVQYSLDGGNRWRVLSPGITERTLVISTSLLGGTTQGRIRVVASDGVNTSHDDSDANFSVPLKPPELQLIAPSDSAHYTYGQTVGFRAEAYDVEDGSLQDEDFTWTSSLDGNLGTGSYLALADLITGTHTITVTATDSDGKQAQRMTTIHVGLNQRVFLPLVLKE